MENNKSKEGQEPEEKKILIKLTPAPDERSEIEIQVNYKFNVRELIGILEEAKYVFMRSQSPQD